MNKLFFNNLNNANLILSSPGLKNYDKYNYVYTGFSLICKGNVNAISLYFYSLFFIQWAHLSYRGKSYRVRNFCNFNKFTFSLGYSHWTKLKLLSNWAFFKRRRQRFVIYTFKLKDMFFFKRFFPHIRFYNCYTMRGLRLKKQPIIRRFGKISQHISILH